MLNAIEQIKVELEERLEQLKANDKLVEAQRWSSARATTSR
jgi:excinuclease ABC subunit B